MLKFVIVAIIAMCLEYKFKPVQKHLVPFWVPFWNDKAKPWINNTAIPYAKKAWKDFRNNQ